MQQKLGVAVIVTKIIDNKPCVLLGKRRNSRGNGTWSFPGGAIELGESIEDAALRELKEETGLTSAYKPLKVLFAEDYLSDANEHWITFFLVIKVPEGELELQEPDKCYGWTYVPVKLFFVHDNLFQPTKSFRDQVLELTSIFGNI